MSILLEVWRKAQSSWLPPLTSSVPGHGSALPAWRQLWRDLQNVWKVQMCLLYFALLSKISITLEFREIILDSLNVWEMDLLHYSIF